MKPILPPYSIFELGRKAWIGIVLAFWIVVFVVAAIVVNVVVLRQ